MKKCRYNNERSSKKKRKKNTHTQKKQINKVRYNQDLFENFAIGYGIGHVSDFHRCMFHTSIFLIFLLKMFKELASLCSSGKFAHIEVF